MNKDALLATVIGFGVGLCIAAIVFIGPSFVKNIPGFRIPSFSLPKISWSLPSFNKTPQQQSPTGMPKPNGVLTIDSPLPESIETKSDILVSGSTNGGAVVVLEGETAETVVSANASGAYAGKVVLGEGKNDITVTSYAGKTVQTHTVRVYYTPEDVTP